jgi:hypothetical protein
MPENSSDSTRERRDYQSDYDYWQAQISAAEKHLQPWNQTTGNLWQSYSSKQRIGGDLSVDKTKLFKLFWSNLQVLRPAIYFRPPKPVVERRFRDKDPVGRVACVLLERNLSFAVEDERFHTAIKAGRDDWLVGGRGATWVSYSAQTGQVQGGEEVLAEQVFPIHWHWRDVIYPCSRSWEIVRDRWLARYMYFTREQAVAEFGDVGNKLPLDYSPNLESNNKDDESIKQARIVQIWDAVSKRVYWYHEAEGDFLKVEDDPLRLQTFYPAPKPLFTSCDSDDLLPVADFLQYADLASTLNLVALKIDTLTEHLRVAGAYDGSQEKLLGKLFNSTKNDWVGLDNWGHFADRRGFDGIMQALPMAELVNTLKVLYDVFGQLSAQIDQISGVSEVIRGYSDPRETATAVNTRAKFAGVRLQEYQSEMARFTRDNLRIMGEIVAEHFSPETIIAVANIADMSEQDKQLIPNALQLLRDDRMRSFRIDIETDSTIAQDDVEEKRARGEFIEFFATFLQKALPAAQQYPALGPVLGETLKWAITGYRAPRTLESQYDETIDKLVAAANGPQQEKPDPKMLEMQQKAQMEQARAQMDAQKAQADMQMKQAEMQQKAQLEVQKLQIELQKIQTDREMKREELATNTRLKEQELALQQQLEGLKLQAQAVAQRQQIEFGLAQQKQVEAVKAAPVKAEKSEPVVVNLQPNITNVPPAPKTRKIVSLETDPVTGKKYGQIQEIPEE